MKIGIENDFWTAEYYEATVVSANDYYPFGSAMAGRKYNQGTYRYGFNGKEEDKEWGSPPRLRGRQMIQDYGFRIYNPTIGKFLSVDPLSSSYPWYTPYQFAGNKVIRCVDLDGLEEYPNYKAYKEAKGKAALKVMDGSDGAWLTEHRESFDLKYEIKYSLSEGDRKEFGIDNTSISGVFANAAQINLKQENSDNYTSINQRTSFYRWTQDKINAKGGDVKWAGAAAEVAANIDKADDFLPNLFGYSNSEAAEFANKGNKAIFNDVLPKLNDLLSNNPLKGEEAKQWDMNALAEEQTLIDPLYKGLSKSTFDDLSKLAKQSWFLVKLAVKSNKFYGDLLKVEDRWIYGMSNMGYENLNTEDMPDVDDKYKDGTELEEVLK